LLSKFFARAGVAKTAKAATEPAKTTFVIRMENPPEKRELFAK
jgi:hypothetical protein